MRRIEERRTRALNHIARCEPLEQEHGHVGAADALVVNRCRGGALCAIRGYPRDGLEREALGFGEDGGPEAVERLADAADAHVVDDDVDVHRKAELVLRE